MKKIVWVFGLIIGVILCINIFYTVHMLYNNQDLHLNEVTAYTAMVVLFSLIYFGIRNYRNKQLNGFISFGKAFKTGFFIALIGSSMYVVVWIFYYYLFVPDFVDIYIPYALREIPADQLATKTAELEQLREMYKNPIFVVLITYFEVLPIGLIVTLVSALLLKRKKKAGTGNDSQKVFET